MVLKLSVRIRRHPTFVQRLVFTCKSLCHFFFVLKRHIIGCRSTVSHGEKYDITSHYILVDFCMKSYQEHFMITFIFDKFCENGNRMLDRKQLLLDSRAWTGNMLTWVFQPCIIRWLRSGGPGRKWSERWNSNSDRSENAGVLLSPLPSPCCLGFREFWWCAIFQDSASRQINNWANILKFLTAVFVWYAIFKNELTLNIICSLQISSSLSSFNHSRS